MKIVSLAASNIKRLTAVQITPEGNIITVGGMNGAGKSSVLDSIAYALGGASLVPPEPIHGAETEGKVEVDLGDYVVTRTFKRDRIVIPSTEPTESPMTEWGPIRSTLAVKNKDGASYSSPQALLDKLMGNLTFDPLQFKNFHPKQQNETLRQITNLDTSVVDGQRKAAYDRRADLKRQLKQAEGAVESLKLHKDAPAEEVVLAEISQRMLKAQELFAQANDAARAVEAAQAVLSNNQHQVELGAREIKNIESQIQELQRRLKEHTTALEKKVHDRDVQKEKVLDLTGKARVAAEGLPDTAALQAELTRAEETNQKVRENKRRQDLEQNVAKLKTAVDTEAKKVEALDTQKETMLAAVKYPVPGLGFNENGVTFNDLPFEQASLAEQVRISVAIGLALNNKVKVLLVRDGNSLDSKSLAMVAQQAEEAGAQIWVEKVTESKDGVSVFIEDGTVV